MAVAATPLPFHAPLGVEERLFRACMAVKEVPMIRDKDVMKRTINKSSFSEEVQRP